MKRGLLWLVSACLGLSGLMSAKSRETAAFDKLAELKGDWKGTYAWSGAKLAKAEAHYSITGNGSAVEENLVQEGIPSMLTVYHLDGAELRLSHFCAAQNQPRLKATSFDSDGKGITFSFVDITNLSSPTAGHVDGLELRFLAPDHITLRFRFVAEGKSKDEVFDLRRKK